MSQYSSMGACSFVSTLSLEEIRRKLVEFLMKQPEEFIKERGRILFLETYNIEEEKPGTYSIVPPGEDYYAKFDHDELLAQFLAQVIEGHTILRFESDDSRWGYLIEKGRVWDIEIAELIKGLPLEEFIETIIVNKQERKHSARYDRCKKYGDVTPNGVVYQWDLAGPGGAWFNLYREPHHTDADIEAAKEYLRSHRDVVGISVVTDETTEGKKYDTFHGKAGARSQLSEKDWMEIYYALDSKAQAIEEGTYDSNKEEERDSFEWSVHLREIMGAIGPDGSNMYPEATPQGPAEPLKIIMRLEGGLIQGVENIPGGIVVEVRDYDTEGMTDEEMAEECEKDEEGHWHVPRPFDKTDCPDPGCHAEEVLP